MLVRRATNGDFDHISALFYEVDEMHHQMRPDLFREPTGAVRSKEFIDSFLQEDDKCIFVATVDLDILGMIVLVQRPPTRNPLLVERRIVDVDTLIVRVEDRGKGVGKSLIKTAIDWAEARGATHVDSSVFAFNRIASASFAKFGFAQMFCRFSLDLTQVGD